MKTFRTLGLAAALALGTAGAVSAAPMSVASGEALGLGQNGIEKTAIVCGRFGCRRRAFVRPFLVRRCFVRATVFGPRRVCR